METISVSNLKAHLSGELKRVQKGTRLIIVDHHRPVAVLAPLPDSLSFVRTAKKAYTVRSLSPLSTIDPLPLLVAEREDSW